MVITGQAIGSRICALPECKVEFTPIVRWQKCCCKEHGARLRWLRRRDRVNSALKIAEAKVS